MLRNGHELTKFSVAPRSPTEGFSMTRRPCTHSKPTRADLQPEGVKDMTQQATSSTAPANRTAAAAAAKPCATPARPEHQPVQQQQQTPGQQKNPAQQQQPGQPHAPAVKVSASALAQRCSVPRKKGAGMQLSHLSSHPIVSTAPTSPQRRQAGSYRLTDDRSSPARFDMQ
jgi:hypothetical protein